MIQQVSYAKVRPWLARAARERVDLSDSPATRWFMREDIACAGLLSLVGVGRVRIRGVYVDPAFRRIGVGTDLGEHLIAVAQAEGYAKIEAYAWSPRWYEERGFAAVGRNVHGAILLRRDLAQPEKSL